MPEEPDFLLPKSLDRWEEHQATFAEGRSIADYELLRDAFRDAHSLHNVMPGAVVDFLYGGGRQEQDPDTGEELRVVVREDLYPDAIASLARAARLLGMWAGYSKKKVAQEIEDAKVIED